MAVVSMRQLLEAGVHFGHQTRRWNPKMKRFIFGERNGIYIIDIQQTIGLLEQSYEFVRDSVAKGGTILFVGTKKQAQEAIEQNAARVGMPYVNYRWLGGMLTNFETIKARLTRLRELEGMETDGTLELLPKKEVLSSSASARSSSATWAGSAPCRRCPTPSGSSTPSRSTSRSRRRTASASRSSPWSTPTATPTSSTTSSPATTTPSAPARC